MQALMQFVSLISDNSDVAATAQQAALDPDAYFAEHEDDLQERGIDDAASVDMVVVIVDALLECEEVAYLDWKETATDALASISELPLIAALDTDILGIDEDIDQDASIEDWLPTLNEHLSQFDVQVVALQEDSDAYPLIAMRADRLEQLVELGEEVDVPVLVFTPEP